MTRALGAFLLLFSLLSLVVHLTAMFEILAAVGVAIVVLESVLERFPEVRAGSIRRRTNSSS